LNALLLSGLGATSRRSVREQELHEVLGEDVGGGSGERVHAAHLHLVVDADGDDVARGDSCRMDLPGPTTSVGTKTDYSVGPWDYLTCAAWYLMA
jgi:hypothetical protein